MPLLLGIFPSWPWEFGCWKERRRPSNVKVFGLWTRGGWGLWKGNEGMPKINLDYVGILPRKWLESLRKYFLLILYSGRLRKSVALILYPVLVRECIPLSYTYAVSWSNLRNTVSMWKVLKCFICSDSVWSRYRWVFISVPLLTEIKIHSSYFECS